MKEVSMKDGRTIHTPWLRVEEAAAYCGISRSTFEIRACGVPYGGGKTLRLYHCSVLDKWMSGGIEDVPPVKKTIQAKTRRIQVKAEDDDVLVNPKNGKIYR